MEMLAALLVRLNEEARDKLVTASPDDFQRLQGEAVAFKRLHDMIFNYKDIG